MAKQSFRLWILVALVVLSALPARAGVGRWTPYGPPEGFLITAAAVDGRLLAATEESGVYASADQGHTWVRASAGLGNEQIEALAVDWDDLEVYAAGQSRFFRSDDQGVHWTALGSLPAEEQPVTKLLALAPGEPDVFFLGIGKTLYRSDDGGQTWIAVLSHTSVVLSILVDPNDANSVFVGTAAPGGLLHSADGGTTWSPVTDVQGPPELPPTTPPFSVDVTEITAADTEPTTLFAISGNRLYRSTDAGASWKYFEIPAEFRNGFDSVLATPGPSPRIYVFQQTVPIPYNRKTLFVSDDLGETWTQVTGDARGTHLLVDPASGDLRSFDFSGIGIAADEGATWHFEPLGTSCGLRSYPRPTAKIRFAPGRTYTVVSGLLWVNRNGQAGWSVLGRDLVDECIAINDVAVDARPNVLWAAASHAVYRSRDNGATWTQSLGPVPVGDGGLPFQGVTVLDSRTILFSGYGIWRSGDRGANWTETMSGLALYDQFDEPVFQRAVYRVRVDPDNPQIVYAGVIDSGERHPLRLFPNLYQSLDGGRTWRHISDQGYTVAIDPSNPKTLYLGTPDGLLRSRDRGRHWTKISDFAIGVGGFVANGSDLLVDPRNPRVLYAARGDEGEGNGVWRSVDGGVTWSPLQIGLDSLPAFELFPDPRRPGRLFVASEGLFEGTFGVPGR
jgi:photosystem II stability/assembly factor-like uncharacterized protein